MPTIWRGCLLVGGVVRLVAARFGVVAPLGARLDASLSHALAMKFVLLYPPTALGAALSEEVLYRFGILTILVWLIARMTFLSPTKTITIWAAIVLQALLFAYAHVSEGIMHLPYGGLATQLAIAPEFWVGLLFGYLYVAFGLEVAVIAHASADLVQLTFFAMAVLKHAH